MRNASSFFVRRIATEVDNVDARVLYRKLDARETGEIVVYDWDGAMDGIDT